MSNSRGASLDSLGGFLMNVAEEAKNLREAHRQQQHTMHVRVVDFRYVYLVAFSLL